MTFLYKVYATSDKTIRLFKNKFLKLIENLVSIKEFRLDNLLMKAVNVFYNANPRVQARNFAYNLKK